MSKWAPIVHGRTLYVDYRPNLIVVPEGFTEREIEWAQKHIHATTRSLDFSERPLWSVFTGERYGIVGVTCWASGVSEDMTHEGQGRRLYVFLGYAAPLPLPGFPPLDLAAFAPLYDFVKERWLEREYDSRGLNTYPFTLDPPLIETGKSTAELNLDVRRAAVWPVSEGERLWRAVGREGTVSLCLGMNRSQEALKSPFLNATAGDVDQPRVLLRREERLVAPRLEEREERRRPGPEEWERHDPHAGRDSAVPTVGLIGFLLMLLIGALRFFFPSSEERPPRRSRSRGVPPGFRPVASDSPQRSKSSEPVRHSGLPPGFRRSAGGERKRDEELRDDWS